MYFNAAQQNNRFPQRRLAHLTWKLALIQRLPTGDDPPRLQRSKYQNHYVPQKRTYSSKNSNADLNPGSRGPQNRLRFASHSRTTLILFDWSLSFI
jgi:hypothetical protein